MVVWLSPEGSRFRVRGTRVSAAGAMLDGTAATDGVILDQTPSGDQFTECRHRLGWRELPRRVESPSRDLARLAGPRRALRERSRAGQLRGKTITVASDSNLDGMNVSVSADRAADPSLRTYLVTWEKEEEPLDPVSARDQGGPRALGDRPGRGRKHAVRGRQGRTDAGRSLRRDQLSRRVEAAGVQGDRQPRQ